MLCPLWKQNSYTQQQTHGQTSALPQPQPWQSSAWSVNINRFTAPHSLETSQTYTQLQHFISKEWLQLEPWPCVHVWPAHLRREYMSSRLFCIGVPVTAHLALALSLHTAIEVWTFGFLILWASSNITRAQATLSREEQGDDPFWKEKKTFYNLEP